MRWISPYTALHILLGVSVTHDEAEVAKAPFPHYAVIDTLEVAIRAV